MLCRVRKQQEEDRLQRRVQEEAVKFLWKQVSIMMETGTISAIWGTNDDQENLARICEVSSQILVTFDNLPNLRNTNYWTSENLKWKRTHYVKAKYIS